MVGMIAVQLHEELFRRHDDPHHRLRIFGAQLFQTQNDVHGVDQHGWNKNHQQHVDALVLQQDTRAGIVLAAVRLGSHVHGILDAGLGRKQAAEFLARSFGEICHAQAMSDGGIGGHDGGPAGIGENAQAVAPWQGILGESQRQVKQLFHGVHADHATLFQQGVGGQRRAPGAPPALRCATSPRARPLPCGRTSPPAGACALKSSGRFA